MSGIKLRERIIAIIVFSEIGMMRAEAKLVDHSQLREGRSGRSIESVAPRPSRKRAKLLTRRSTLVWRGMYDVTCVTCSGARVFILTASLLADLIEQ